MTKKTGGPTESARTLEAEPSRTAPARPFGPSPSSACELPATPPILDGSRVLHHNGAGWDGVRVLPYKSDTTLFEGVTRRVLASPEHAAYEVRYFELDPGGYSTYERHAHVHVVIGHCGRGRVRLGDAVHEVGFGDVVYVAPDEPHQFLNPYTDPFGFLCIVDRERDRPVPMGD